MSGDRSPSTTSQPQGLDALVIGAGFSGLYQLHTLRDQLGLNTVLVEAGDGVGGTWYWNRYPGARSDSESHYYSYSFSKELQHEWYWTERFPPQREIRSYLDHVAERFDLKRSIRFGTRVQSAVFDETEGRWLITTDKGETFSTLYFIPAVGTLSAANVPNFPGLKDFKGEWYHTASWPDKPVDFKGKRVGLIGTGSSGIQASPIISKDAANFTLFQRTPNYTLPARNHKLTDEFQRFVRENYDAIRTLTRSTFHGHAFEETDFSALDVDEEERLRRYEEAWKVGGLRFLNVFSDLFYNIEANNTVSDFIRSKIAEVVKDPEKRAALTPTRYPIGARRPTTGTDYYEMFNRQNVTLVDVGRSPIVTVTPDGVETTEKEYLLDMLILATGFDAISGPLLAIDIRGRGGQTIQEAWAEGPHTLFGIQTPGFPNMFMITGPGSPSVLANAPVAIEQHVDWITQCIRTMRERGKTWVEPTQAAVDEWDAEMQRAADMSLLGYDPNSWYTGANIPGKVRVVLPYAGGMPRYKQLLEQATEADYSGFAFS